jgi:hypothetical protein
VAATALLASGLPAAVLPGADRAAAATVRTRVPNPSLERAGSSRAVPACWHRAGRGANSYAFARTRNAHRGTWAERLTVTSYRSGNRHLAINRSGRCAPQAVPGARYRLGAWYRSSARTHWALSVRDAATKRWRSWPTSGSATRSRTWARATLTTPPVPAGVDRISFGLALRSRGVVTVDDLSLARVRAGAGRQWYVSRQGSGGNGRSWATAWNELGAIDWSVVRPGDTVLVDGGATRCRSAYDFTTTRPGVSCGMTYGTTLRVGVSGVAGKPVVIRKASDPGRNGTVVLFGGRAEPLPYCHQSSYSAPDGLRQLVDLNGQSYVTLDGVTRSGFMAYGGQKGVEFGSDDASHVVLRNMEVFDNGTADGGGDGFSTDGENITLRGHHLTFDRLLVHDGGQDNFQDEDHADGTSHDLAFTNSWIYFARENPEHPGYSFNEPQSTGCTHADGIQTFSGGEQSGLVVDHVVFGPGGNQGLYLGDGATGARWTGVQVRSSLFLAAHSHNLISDLPVHGWRLDNVTVYAPRGGSELPSDGPMTITDSLKAGGYWDADRSDWTASGNVTSGEDPLPGATASSAKFVGPLPTTDPPRFAQLLAADFTPTCRACAGVGSPMHRATAVLSRIDALNAKG